MCSSKYDVLMKNSTLATIIAVAVVVVVAAGTSWLWLRGPVPSLSPVAVACVLQGQPGSDGTLHEQFIVKNEASAAVSRIDVHLFPAHFVNGSWNAPTPVTLHRSVPKGGGATFDQLVKTSYGKVQFDATGCEVDRIAFADGSSWVAP
jgi:hypothetical protein